MNHVLFSSASRFLKLGRIPSKKKFIFAYAQSVKRLLIISKA
jgi:hypothetical protein